MEFQKLSWPSADLIIEPDPRLTLVNRNTAAHAPDNGPQTKNITLLGQRITIEATPSNWTWHWGDGSTHVTDHPGQPQPNATITHSWARAGEVTARVDITYVGRYRLNGGAWTTIPGTHTVTGPNHALDVVEALPQLVR